MDGFEQLGSILGGGIDREGAARAGALQGARTEEAIARARNARDEANNRERLAEALVGLGIPEELAVIMRGGFGNFQQGTAGLGNIQEQGFRGDIADPATDPEARQFARAALFADPSNPALADALTQAKIVTEQSRGAASDALAGLRGRTRPLLQDPQDQALPAQGLQAQAGPAQEITATGQNGEKFALRNGEWVLISGPGG